MLSMRPDGHVDRTWRDLHPRDEGVIEDDETPQNPLEAQRMLQGFCNMVTMLVLGALTFMSNYREPLILSGVIPVMILTAIVVNISWKRAGWAIGWALFIGAILLGTYVGALPL
ncbi:hypothetical protein HGA91_05680 [candidate division WWE3 bacterium]|nr:hypothetical protein [candidate division WWE3 bacterium]